MSANLSTLNDGYLSLYRLSEREMKRFDNNRRLKWKLDMLPSDRPMVQFTDTVSFFISALLLKSHFHSWATREAVVLENSRRRKLEVDRQSTSI